MKDNIGHLVKHLRKQKGYSLRKLSTLTGVSASTLSRLENGNLDIAYSSLLAIYKVLEVPLEPSGFFIELTEAEKEYIWLLTAIDALRIKRLENDEEKDFNYRIRHNLRKKLVG